MSEDLGIGKVITNPDMNKDAIHIPVMPMKAGEFLEPGDKVMFEGDGVDRVVKAKKKNDAVVGVVDPYLETNVQANQTFWLFLFPGSITSLRHDWEHPTLAARLNFGGRAAARKRLEAIAETSEIDYEEMMDLLDGAQESRTSSAHTEYDFICDDLEAMWRDWGLVRNKKPKFNGVPYYYHCC